MNIFENLMLILSGIFCALSLYQIIFNNSERIYSYLDKKNIFIKYTLIIFICNLFIAYILGFFFDIVKYSLNIINIIKTEW